MAAKTPAWGTGSTVADWELPRRRARLEGPCPPCLLRSGQPVDACHDREDEAVTQVAMGCELRVLLTPRGFSVETKELGTSVQVEPSIGMSGLALASGFSGCP